MKPYGGNDKRACTCCGSPDKRCRARETKGGQHVPFHGDFAAVAKLPPFVQAAEWWARHLRTALEGEL